MITVLVLSFNLVSSNTHKRRFYQSGNPVALQSSTAATTRPSAPVHMSGVGSAGVNPHSAKASGHKHRPHKKHHKRHHKKKKHCGARLLARISCHHKRHHMKKGHKKHHKKHHHSEHKHHGKHHKKHRKFKMGRCMRHTLRKMRKNHKKCPMIKKFP